MSDDELCESMPRRSLRLSQKSPVPVKTTTPMRLRRRNSTSSETQPSTQPKPSKTRRLSLDEGPTTKKLTRSQLSKIDEKKDNELPPLQEAEESSSSDEVYIMLNDEVTDIKLVNSPVKKTSTIENLNQEFASTSLEENEPTIIGKSKPNKPEDKKESSVDVKQSPKILISQIATHDKNEEIVKPTEPDKGDGVESEEEISLDKLSPKKPRTKTSLSLARKTSESSDLDQSEGVSKTTDNQISNEETKALPEKMKDSPKITRITRSATQKIGGSVDVDKDDSSKIMSSEKDDFGVEMKNNVPSDEKPSPKILRNARSLSLRTKDSSESSDLNGGEKDLVLDKTYEKDNKTTDEYEKSPQVSSSPRSLRSTRSSTQKEDVDPKFKQPDVTGENKECLSTDNDQSPREGLRRTRSSTPKISESRGESNESSKGGGQSPNIARKARSSTPRISETKDPIDKQEKETNTESKQVSTVGEQSPKILRSGRALITTPQKLDDKSLPDKIEATKKANSETELDKSFDKTSDTIGEETSEKNGAVEDEAADKSLKKIVVEQKQIQCTVDDNKTPKKSVEEKKTESNKVEMKKTIEDDTKENKSTDGRHNIRKSSSLASNAEAETSESEFDFDEPEKQEKCTNLGKVNLSEKRITRRSTLLSKTSSEDADSMSLSQIMDYFNTDKDTNVRRSPRITKGCAKACHCNECAVTKKTELSVQLERLTTNLESDKIVSEELIHNKSPTQSDEKDRDDEVVEVPEQQHAKSPDEEIKQISIDDSKPEDSKNVPENELLTVEDDKPDSQKSSVHVNLDLSASEVKKVEKVETLHSDESLGGDENSGEENAEEEKGSSENVEDGGNKKELPGSDDESQKTDHVSISEESDASLEVLLSGNSESEEEEEEEDDSIQQMISSFVDEVKKDLSVSNPPEESKKEKINSPKFAGKTRKKIDLPIHVDSKIDELLKTYQETRSESNSEEEEDQEDNFILTMAEEGDEETPSEDSNAIIDEGEEINTTESEISTDETYDDEDSFINDEEKFELLPGDKDDLSLETKRKSRIIKFDSDGENDTIVNIERKSTPKKPTKIRIINRPNDDSEEEVPELIQTPQEDDQSKKIIILEDIKIPADAKQSSHSEEDQQITDDEDVNNEKETSDNSIAEEYKKQINKKIVIKENISLTDIKSKRLSDEIHKVMKVFCSEIKKQGSVSVNLALDYTANSSDDEDKPVTLTKAKKKKRKNIKQNKAVHLEEQQAEPGKIANEHETKKRKDLQQSENQEKEHNKLKRRKKNKQNQVTSQQDGQQNTYHTKERKNDFGNKTTKNITKQNEGKEQSDENIGKKNKKKNNKRRSETIQGEKEISRKKQKKNIPSEPESTTGILADAVFSEMSKHSTTKTVFQDGWEIEKPKKKLKPSAVENTIVPQKPNKKSPSAKGNTDLHYHNKDFKNRMLYDPKRIPRMETGKLLKKYV